MLIRKLFAVLITSFMLIALTNCCTTKNELKEEKKYDAINLKKEYAPIPLAPGTAEISCAISEIIKKDDKSLCKIKVNEVKRYGPATKPIGIGSEIDLEINDDSIEKIKNSFSNKNEITLTIAVISGGMGQELSNAWKLIKINK